jgi:hypothetical protein
MASPPEAPSFHLVTEQLPNPPLSLRVDFASPLGSHINEQGSTIGAKRGGEDSVSADSGFTRLNDGQFNRRLGQFPRIADLDNYHMRRPLIIEAEGEPIPQWSDATPKGREEMDASQPTDHLARAPIDDVDLVVKIHDRQQSPILTA